MLLKKTVTSLIKDLLQKNPAGLSITDIVKEVNINRNTAGRYLETLLVSGQVEMRRLGMAKIYVLSQRVPLSAVLSISTELVVQLDSGLRIVFANEPFLKLIGTDSKSLLGKNIEYTPVALLFEDFFTEFIENLKEGVGGKEWVGEISITSNDIILVCRIAPTAFDDGRKGVSVIFEDVTQRKQVEQTLLESEAKFHSIAENSPDMILMLNHNLDIVYINKTITLNSDRVFGKSIYDFVPKKFHPAATACFKQVLETGKPAVYNTEYYFENDKTLYFESTVGPVLKEGEISALVINARDITERKKAEKVLKESEERYRKLVEISPDAVIIHQQGKIIFMNPSAVNMLGASSPDEIIGKNLLEFIQSDFREAVKKNIEKDLDGDKTPPTEVHMLRLDGASVIVEGSGVRTFIDGKPAIQVAIRDITERKQAERKLRESEEKLATVLESITDIMSMMGKDLTILWANQPAKQCFGKDIIGKKCYEVYQRRQEPCEPYPCPVLRSFSDGQIHQHEVALIDKESGKRYFEGTANVVLRDTSGNPVAVMEIGREITGKKKTELALRQNEEQLRLILDSTDDIIIMQDPEGRYLYFNSAARYGISVKDVLGLSPYDFVDRESADRLMDRLKNVVKTGQSIREETLMVWKDQTLWFSDSLSPVRDATGSIIAVVTVSQNISDRKRAEMALRESEATARALINAPTDSVILMDTQGIILALNETAAVRFGKRIDELVGVLADDLLPEEVARSRRSLVSRVLETKEMVRFEDERNGIEFDTVAYPILSDTGDVIKIAIVARDITEQKNTAKKLRESEKRFQ
ncbi:MAG: PAS domain S-box protein [Candidatus Atribacteria bacterium]|nr:MAG: PAS domain S-box protein [Candidatus Atribacteria bacterium]